MISVRRGEEPEDLRKVRFGRLARALLGHQKGQVPRDEDLVGYGIAKESLLAAQDNRCVYCEGPIREGDDVEHFRPKRHYWWLTWSWDNLFVACSTCNDSAHKGARFALADETTRLLPGERPPGEEQPLLLDPADPQENPIDHIEFYPLGGRWQPIARAKSLRGNHSITTLGLAVGPILDHYETQRENLQPRIEAAQNAIAAGDAPKIQATWQALIGNAFSRRQSFQGLMYDVIARAFPAAQRARWNLMLPKPGDGRLADPPLCDRHVPAHDALPEGLAMCVRALGGRPEAAERDAVILQLCADRARTRVELADILEREPATIRRVLDDLVQRGQLVVTQTCYRKT